jgi:hypothetical protein
VGPKTAALSAAQLLQCWVSVCVCGRIFIASVDEIRKRETEQVNRKEKENRKKQKD